MFYGAIWVAEQEFKAYQWLYARHPHGKFSDLSKKEQIYLESVFILNAMGLGTLAVSPYSYIIRSTGKMAEYQAAFEAGEYASYSMRKSSPHFIRRKVVKSVSAKYAAKYALSKIGSRFVPYVGWALFVYDMWNVGTWLGEKTDPFD